MKVFPLPKLEQFLDIGDDYDPFERFYAWVLKEALPLKDLLYKKHDEIDSELMSRINVSSVILHEDDSRELVKLYSKFLKSRWKKLPKKQLNYQVEMTKFSIGPTIATNEEYEPGFVYLKEDFLQNRKEK